MRWPVKISDLSNAERTLYVRRDLLNHEVLTKWAEDAGLHDIVDDMHVTIVYSKTAVDWDALTPDESHVTVEGGERGIEVFGDSATVLTFECEALSDRHDEFGGIGASFDFDKYRPHVTLSYSEVSLSGIEPYEGELVFGPEIYEEIEP